MTKILDSAATAADRQTLPCVPIFKIYFSNGSAKCRKVGILLVSYKTSKALDIGLFGLVSDVMLNISKQHAYVCRFAFEQT